MTPKNNQKLVIVKETAYYLEVSQMIGNLSDNRSSHKHLSDILNMRLQELNIKSLMMYENNE